MGEEVSRLGMLGWRTWAPAVVESLLGRRSATRSAPGELGPRWMADSQPTDNSRCSADWRRPDRHWHCVRHDGHNGRHTMRRSSQSEI